MKQKISGQFKSDQGAGGFAVLGSVIDTTIKTGQNVLNYRLSLNRVLNSYETFIINKIITDFDI